MSDMKEVELFGGNIDSCLKRLREMASDDGEVLKYSVKRKCNDLNND